MARKNATLRALVNGILYDLMPRGSIYNIYVDENTTLAAKLAEVIASLNGKVTNEELAEVTEEVLEEAQASGLFDGAAGPRGTGILYITTAPTSYTTATGGFTPKYRIALSTVLTQSGGTEVLAGDMLSYSYYLYPVGYVDSSYVYLGTRKSIRGATGATGPESNVTSYSAQNVADSIRLTGKDKTSLNPIVQSSDAESTILVKSNESGVEHVRLSNSGGHAGKIGIDVGYPAQRLTFYDIYIEDNYAVGVRIPTAYYSQFNSCWFQGDTGIEIGQVASPSNWIGVLDFLACHLNNCDVAFKIYAKDTNTICLDKCSFEGDKIAIDSVGTLYVRNTYFGDQPNTTDTLGVLVARPGSKTDFRDCTIGVSAFAGGGRSSIFDLRSDATDGPALVTVQGGMLGLSNNFNCSGSESSIYAADSADCLIYLDFVRLIQPTTNLNHNRAPFYVYDGYSPLRSHHPLRNYVANGTMRSILGNALLLSHSTAYGLSMHTSMVNPYGGSVLNATGMVKYFYRIPRHMVGKEMTLELLMYTPTTSGLTVASDELGVVWGSVMHQYETERRPALYRVNCTPTAETGVISISQAAAFKVYGVVLKEARYMDTLSCYEDIDELLSNEAPRTTTGATHGDIVDSINPAQAGWKYDSGWQENVPVTYTIEYSGGAIRLLGSDGSESSAVVVETRSVQYKLTKCTSTNTGKTAVLEGEYTTTLVADEDYGINSVVVTMGDVDITAQVYDSETQTIYIPAVTGRVVITATAVYVPFVYVVPDLAVAPRNAWYCDNTTNAIDLHSGNANMAIGVSTANNYGFTDRESNKIYVMPVPAKASKVTVAINDGVEYKYQFRTFKESGGVLNPVGNKGSWVTTTTTSWVAGAVSHILIWAETTSGSGVPWGYNDSNVTVTFESAEG